MSEVKEVKKAHASFRGERLCDKPDAAQKTLPLELWLHGARDKSCPYCIEAWEKGKAQ